MTVAKPLIMDGNIARIISQGDVLAGAEILANVTNAGSVTLSAAQMLSGIINRTGPAAGYNDFTDTAANIITGLIGQGIYNVTSVTGISSGAAVQPGTTVRLRFLNTVAFINTLAANTGVTLAGVTAIPATSFKDYLITVVNGTPPQIFTASQINGSAVLTGMSQFQTAQLSVGMLITGTNVAGNIVSIQPGVGVTMSTAATATLNLNAITFAPTVTVTGLGGGPL